MWKLVAASTAAVAAAGVLPPPHARGGKLYADLVARVGNVYGNTTVNYFDQPIWHNDTSKGTFQQRWYVDTSFWDGTGPVFMYIGGEGPQGGTAGGFVSVQAQEHKALQLALEHRYYGESLPAPLTDSATLETLTVETALADLANFVTWARGSFGVPASAPTLAIGGSYPGALSAWAREKYPDVFAVSWSSSGVVNAVYNFTGFDEQIVADIPVDCADAIRAAYAQAEAMWADPAQKPALLALFGTPDYFTLEDFMWMLADSAAMGPQYGAKAALCAAMTGSSSNPIKAFADWTNTHYGPSFGSGCYYSTECLSNPAYAAQWPNQMPWVRQCCREVAYWQVAYPGSLRSSLITLDYFDGQCEKAFGFKPDTAAFNAFFGGATPDATKVIALGGSDDPWRRASVMATINATYVEMTATCDGCGHCGDLHAPSPSESPAITAQHAFIDAYLRAWLQPAAATAVAGK